ncbi:hypothetical protein ACFPVS_01795 [Neisseria weixii]|uniref:hypothetical protein n=1 Tax=Neisseria weixii TaxID=1853276 RepID=UPI000BB87401|nr:hypothetical protein [Neisseria weixii]ATD64503.1 hypothetical protein CGZ65_02770 [Neisseria weixii]
MKKTEAIKKFDAWVYKNRIAIFFNVFSSVICIIFVLLSGLGRFSDSQEKIIKIPDGIIYIPKFQSKNPWVSFIFNKKKYSFSCIDFNYQMCKEFHNQELLGYNVLFLLPDSDYKTTSGLILNGEFISDSNIHFSIHNDKDKYLNREKKFRYLGLFFYYFSCMYFVIILLLIARIFYMECFLNKTGVSKNV